MFCYPSDYSIVIYVILFILNIFPAQNFYFNLLNRSLVTGNHGLLIVIFLKLYHFFINWNTIPNNALIQNSEIFFFIVSTPIISMCALAYCGYCIFGWFFVVSQLINSFNSHLSIFDSNQFYTIRYAKLLMLIVCRGLSVQPTVPWFLFLF